MPYNNVARRNSKPDNIQAENAVKINMKKRL